MHFHDPYRSFVVPNVCCSARRLDFPIHLSYPQECGGHRMDRTGVLGLAAGILVAGAFLKIYRAYSVWNGPPIRKTDEEWRKILTPEQYHILREGGTEPPFSSPLIHEQREGTFVCIACDSPLFSSKFKYDSSTGWPSFFKVMDANISIKIDHNLDSPRTEYHCARC